MSSPTDTEKQIATEFPQDYNNIAMRALKSDDKLSPEAQKLEEALITELLKKRDSITSALQNDVHILSGLMDQQALLTLITNKESYKAEDIAEVLYYSARALKNIHDSMLNTPKN